MIDNFSASDTFHIPDAAPTCGKTTLERTLPAVLERGAALYADRPALSAVGSVPITYAELFDNAVSLGAFLSDHGVVPGDRVCILSENSPQWAVAYFAITYIGAVAVPVLPEFHANAIAHIIRDAETKAVFISEKLLYKLEDADFDHKPLFINIETFTPIEQDITKDRLRELKEAGFREFRKWKEKAMRAAGKNPHRVQEDDLAVIIYTSGTTGHSKGVMLSHKNIVFDAMAVEYIEPIRPEDRFLSILPLPHTYECTVGLVLPVMSGSQVFYLGKTPTPRVLMPALAEVRPTIMLAVPLIIEKIYKNSILPKLTSGPLMRLLYSFSFSRRLLLKAAGKKLQAAFGGCLRGLVIGGAPLAADAEKFLFYSGFPYVFGYGLTETSPLVSASTLARPRLSSTGPAVHGVQVRIADPEPTHGVGEIQVKGENVMMGYYKAPDITKEVFTEDGWFRTGDLGSIDEEGFVSIRGRSKNMVLGPSGENIYPEEIESFLFASPYVQEALVYMSDGKLSARVYLDTALLDDLCASLSQEEREKRIGELLEKIREEVNAQVSSFSRIQRIAEQTEPFEKTATQKIKRYLYLDT